MSHDRVSGLGAGIVVAFLVFLTSAPSLGAEERVSFKNAAGEKIVAAYVAADTGNTAPMPAVVMLHGCSGLFTNSGKIKARERMWIELLHHEGWAVLLPDSFGSRGFGSLCQTKERPLTPAGRQIDARAALDYLLTVPGIDPARIALMGWSNGAMTALKVVRDGSDVAPASGTPDFRAAVLFYPGCIAERKEHPDYKARLPTLIQHGALDDWTLAAPCRELVAAAQHDGAPMQIDIYPDAYHDFDHPTSVLKAITTKHSGYASGERTVHVGANPAAREQAIPRTIGWLRGYLRGN